MAPTGFIINHKLLEIPCIQEPSLILGAWRLFTAVQNKTVVLTSPDQLMYGNFSLWIKFKIASLGVLYINSMIVTKIQT